MLIFTNRNIFVGKASFHQKSQFSQEKSIFTRKSRFLQRIPISIVHRKDREDKCSDQNFYVAGDNKDCVPVVGNIGLTNLWKSHLCKFHSVTLDTAEAIIKEYPSSSKLIRVSQFPFQLHFLDEPNPVAANRTHEHLSF